MKEKKGNGRVEIEEARGRMVKRVIIYIYIYFVLLLSTDQLSDHYALVFEKSW
jgi:hypothetical protein